MDSNSEIINNSPIEKKNNFIRIPPETSEQRLISEILFLSVMLIAVGFLGEYAKLNVLYTWILTIIFFINLTIRFILVNEKGDWLFFLFGVLGGGGNDLLSMINGVYNYTSITILPFLDGLMPFWMILYWGQIVLLFRKIFNIKWFKGEEFKKNKQYCNGWIDKQLVFDIVILVILRITIYRTYKLEPWIPSLIYFIFIGLRILIFRPKKNTWLIIAILPYAYLFEGLMVTFGLYEYYYPFMLGMPGWLFIWWIFLVPIFTKEISERLEYIVRKKL